ncbi:MAG: SGNH/GDSL hydrolase family protein [Myxococcota bacterium]
MLLFAVTVAHAQQPEAPPPGEPAPASSAEPRAPHEPAAVVAIGDGVVAGFSPAPEAVTPADTVEPARMVTATVPGGWVPVLADCLEERAPQRFSVVDRAVTAETLVSARQRVSAVRDLSPGFVVVTLGAQELNSGEGQPADLKQLRGELDDLVGDLVGKGRKATRPMVLLLSMVPANLAQGGVTGEAEAVETQQREVDTRIGSWNDALSQVAKGNDLVTHVNLLADWPAQPDARAALTERGWTLSDQGHARVAAAVCDAILAAARP